MYKGSKLKPLTSISVCAALGDESQLAKFLDQAFEEDLSLVSIEEILIQTALFAGVPRALNGFRILEDSLNRLDKEKKDKLIQEAAEKRGEKVEDSFQAGEILFEKVYGERSQELRGTLSHRHSFFESWIIDSAYGKILSRSGLTILERELGAVAALVALNTPIQLFGHMKGALRNGATIEMLTDVMNWIDELLPDNIGHETLEKIKRTF